MTPYFGQCGTTGEVCWKIPQTEGVGAREGRRVSSDLKPLLFSKHVSSQHQWSLVRGPMVL